MPDYNGVTWRVNYGEIAERDQFRVGYIGQQSFDGYFELAQLSDLITVLSAVQGAPLNQLTKGSTVQARKTSDGVVTTVIIEPRSDTFPAKIMSLGLATLSDLIYALQLFQTATPGAPIPDDWDLSFKPVHVVLDKKGQLQPAEAFSKAVDALYGSVTMVTAYGAVGDGITDDSYAVATALAATPDYGVLWFPKGTYRLVTPLLHTRTRVSISGPGRINGKLIVGDFGANYDFQGRSINGLTFTRGVSSTDATVACIELRNVLNLTIEGNSFRDAGSAIYVPTEYDTARNIIQGNLYNNVGYFLRSVTGPTPPGRDPNLQWRSIADIQVIDNSGQTTVTALDIDSIDGLVCVGNTFFSPGYQNASAIKQRNIRIGYSDWVIITSNNLFEAGLESIDLTDANHFTIKNNNIAWPGQRVPSDAISIRFSARTFADGNIGGGNVSQATKNVVGFYGTGVIDLRAVVIDHISIERSIGSAPAQYYGTDPLPTPYRVYVPSTLNSSMPILPPAPAHSFGLNLPDNHRGRIISEERWLSGTVKEQTMFLRTTTITSTQFLYVLRTADGSGNGHFAGTVHLYMTNDGSTVKSAYYTLDIIKTPGGQVACTTISAIGNTTGAAANDPSFTFDVFLHTDNSYYLRATKVGSTSGAFGYTGWATGPIQLA